MTKKTILIDLDGVLNTYESNYDEGCIPLIKDGAYELLKELSSDYRIVIFTSRNLLLASKIVRASCSSINAVFGSFSNKNFAISVFTLPNKNSYFGLGAICRDIVLKRFLAPS